MGLPEELYFAMVGVGWQAKWHKIPGPLARSMIDIAQKSLDLCQQDERAAIQFARLVLSRAEQSAVRRREAFSAGR